MVNTSQAELGSVANNVFSKNNFLVKKYFLPFHNGVIFLKIKVFAKNFVTKFFLQ